MSDREYLTEPLDEDEERTVEGYKPTSVRSYMYSPMGELVSAVRLLSKCVQIRI